MDAEFIDRPGSSYVLLDEDTKAKKRASRAVYEKFLHMRGKILTETVNVERHLSRVIATYFCPSLICDIPLPDRVREDMAIRRAAFVDVIMGRPGVSWGTKVGILKGIMTVADLRRDPCPDGLVKLLRVIADTRNRFAHARVAINWNTHDLSLWDAERGGWGVIPQDLPKRHEQRCAKAYVMISSVGFQVNSIPRGDASRGART